MPRLPPVTVSDEIYELLLKQSEETGAPLAELIRRYLVKGMTASGHTITAPRVQHGGKRDKPPGGRRSTR